MSDEAAAVFPPVQEWVDRLSRPVGDPGGGAASGVMIAMSAALLHMVATYTHGDDRIADCCDRLDARRLAALEAAEADSAVSAALGAALRTPDGDADDPDRDARVRAAAIDGAGSSARLGEAGAALEDELTLLADIGNHSLDADTVVAAAALVAGLTGAITNLGMNLALAGAHREDGDGDDARLDELRAQEERLRAVRETASGFTELEALRARRASATA